MKKTGYKELAKEAGVSFKTVYRVLNHEANVRKETRDRVLEVLSRNGRLDYFPARSGSVVIIANLLIPYYALRGTELLGLLSTEFNCFIFDSLRNRKKIVRSMEVSDIVVCFGAIPDGLETELRNANPAVRIVNAYGRGGDISILVDECELGCSAAKYLAERGHRKIWIPMQKRTDCLESIPRTWMFKSYMQEHFPETDVRFVNYEDFDEIMTASPFPDAIWAPRSGDADFACSRLRELGIRVPEQLSFLSTDLPTDLPYQKLSNLDTVYFSTGQVAELIRYCILKQPIQRTTGHITMSTEIRISSCGSVKNINTKGKG